MAEQDELFEPDEIIQPAAARPLNRNGRPKGSRNLRHYYLEKLAKENAIALVRSVIASAIAGDMVAAKIIMDRLWPRPRTAPIAVDLPATETPADIRTAMSDLLKQTVTGEISTDDGQALMSMLKDQLAAHSIRTVEGTEPINAQASDAREQLFLKLRTAIERRDQQEPGATIQ